MNHKTDSRVGQPAFEVLELCAGKLACTVLRGLGGWQHPPGYLTAAQRPPKPATQS